MNKNIMSNTTQTNNDFGHVDCRLCGDPCCHEWERHTGLLDLVSNIKTGRLFGFPPDSKKYLEKTAKECSVSLGPIPEDIDLNEYASIILKTTKEAIATIKAASIGPSVFISTVHVDETVMNAFQMLNQNAIKALAKSALETVERAQREERERLLWEGLKT